MSAAFHVPASGGDDAPAINAALATYKAVELGPEAYKQASMIIVPGNCSLRGQGWGTTITKIANTDAFEMQYGASVERISWNGNAFRGRGAVIRSGQHYQRLGAGSITSQECCVHFEAPDAGGHMTVDDMFITRAPDLTAFAIQLPFDTMSGGNRTFRNIRFGGGYGIDLAGANNTMVDRINASQIQMHPNLGSLMLMNSRIGGRVEFHGRRLWVGFNNISNGIWIHGDVYDSLFIATHSNNPITRTDAAGNKNVVL